MEEEPDLSMVQVDLAYAERKLTFDSFDQFSDHLMQSFDDGDTYVNMASTCGMAIKLAIEYRLTGRLPPMTPKIKPSNGAAVNALLSQSIILLRAEPLRADDVDTNVLRRLPAFGMVALCMDALTSGYVDRIAAVKTFDFLIHPSVFMRYRLALDIIHQKFGCEEGLVWHPARQKTLSDGSVINTKPTLLATDVAIHILHKPTLGNDDMLEGAASASICDRPLAYIVNIFDAHVVKVQVRELCAGGFLEKTLRYKTTKESLVSHDVFFSRQEDLIKKIISKKN